MTTTITPAAPTTYPLPALHTAGRPHRVYTRDNLPSFDTLARRDARPDMVPVTAWNTAQAHSFRTWPGTSRPDEPLNDGRVTLDVYRYEHGLDQPCTNHPLSGTEYASSYDADKATFDAGLCGFLVYESDLGRWGITYRWTRHRDESGGWCPYSHIPADGHRHYVGGDWAHCPNGCAASALEIHVQEPSEAEAREYTIGWTVPTRYALKVTGAQIAEMTGLSADWIAACADTQDAGPLCEFDLLGTAETMANLSDALEEHTHEGNLVETGGHHDIAVSVA